MDDKLQPESAPLVSPASGGSGRSSFWWLWLVLLGVFWRYGIPAILDLFHQRIGVRIAAFGLRSVNGVSYTTTSLQRTRNNTKQKPFNIDYVTIERISLDFHRPKAEDGSWICIRIRNPKVKLRKIVGKDGGVDETGGVEAARRQPPSNGSPTGVPQTTPASTSSPATATQKPSQPSKRKLSKQQRLMRFISQFKHHPTLRRIGIFAHWAFILFLRLIELEVVGLEVTVRDSDGANIQYSQDRLSLGIRSESADMGVSTESLHLSGSNDHLPNRRVGGHAFRLVLSISPFKVVHGQAASSDTTIHGDPLIRSDATSTLSLSIDTSVVRGDLKHSEIDVHINNVSVSLTELLPIAKSFGNPKPKETTAETSDIPAASSPSLSRSDPRSTDATNKQSNKMHRGGPNVDVGLLNQKLSDAFRIVMQLKPKINILFHNPCVTFNSLDLGIQTPVGVNIPSVLVTTKHVGLTVEAISDMVDKQPRNTLHLKFAIDGFHIDLFNIKLPRASSTSQLFSISHVGLDSKVEVDLPAAERISQTTREGAAASGGEVAHSPIKSFNVDVNVVDPSFTLQDWLVPVITTVSQAMKQLKAKRKRPAGQLPPGQEDTHKTTQSLVDKLHLASVLILIARPSVKIRVQRPVCRLVITSYQTTLTSSGSVSLSLGVDEINITMSRVIMEGSPVEQSEVLSKEDDAAAPFSATRAGLKLELESSCIFFDVTLLGNPDGDRKSDDMFASSKTETAAAAPPSDDTAEIVEPDRLLCIQTTRLQTTMVLPPMQILSSIARADLQSLATSMAESNPPSTPASPVFPAATLSHEWRRIYHGRILNIDVESDWDMSDVLVDLSLLVCSPSVDYFALAVILSNLIPQTSEKSGTESFYGSTEDLLQPEETTTIIFSPPASPQVQLTSRTQSVRKRPLKWIGRTTSSNSIQEMASKPALINSPELVVPQEDQEESMAADTDNKFESSTFFPPEVGAILVASINSMGVISRIHVVLIGENKQSGLALSVDEITLSHHSDVYQSFVIKLSAPTMQSPENAPNASLNSTTEPAPMGSSSAPLKPLHLPRHLKKITKLSGFSGLSASLNVGSRSSGGVRNSTSTASLSTLAGGPTQRDSAFLSPASVQKKENSFATLGGNSFSPPPHPADNHSAKLELRSLVLRAICQLDAGAGTDLVHQLSQSQANLSSQPELGSYRSDLSDVYEEDVDTVFSINKIDVSVNNVPSHKTEHPDIFAKHQSSGASSSIHAKVEIEDVQINYHLRIVYVALVACVYVLKLSKILIPRSEQEKTPPPQHRDTLRLKDDEPDKSPQLGDVCKSSQKTRKPPAPLHLTLLVNWVELNIELPEDVRLRGLVKNVEVVTHGDKTVTAGFSSLKVFVPVPISDDTVDLDTSASTSSFGRGAGSPQPHSPTFQEEEMVKWEELLLVSDVMVKVGKSSPARSPSQKRAKWGVGGGIAPKMDGSGATTPTVAQAVSVDARIESLSLTIPFNFELADVIENAVNSSKAIKQLFIDLLGASFVPPPDSGKTYIDPNKVPTISVNVTNAKLTLIDDPFEAKLNRNFQLGFDEQGSRIAREKAFQKKANALRNRKESQLSMDSSLTSSMFSSSLMSSNVEIENAYWMLQEHNSRIWVDIIRKDRAQTPTVPLMTTTFSDLRLTLSAPSLPASTVEESLHELESNTPKEKCYDDLIPRDIDLSFNGVEMRLRDFPHPFILVPNPRDGSSTVPTWRTEGLLIIAEQIAHSESKRKVVLPLHEWLPTVVRQPLVVTRTVNPVKIYTRTTTTISTSSSVCFTWGASYDPAITDMARVLDSFTKPNVDPSPPIGWWDKVRIIMHGRNEFNVTGGGGIKFRLLGSMNPYFDPRKHFGTEGLELVAARGIRLEFGSGGRSEQSGENEDFLLECGELCMNIPSTVYHQFHHPDANRTVQDDVIAKLKGGVKLTIGFKFMVADRDANEDDEFDFEFVDEVTPTRTHNDIVLRSPEYAANEYSLAYDAFRGFRTNTMHLSVKVTSPRPFYSSLAPPINCLSLNPICIERFRVLPYIYNSPLTNVPIHRGEIFNHGAPVIPKPKLSRAMGSVHLKVCMYPLVLGFMHELEDHKGGVGIRCRAEKWDVDMSFVQRFCRRKMSSDSSAGPSVKRIATKWTLDASEMVFTELEARAISFGVNPDDPYIKAETQHPHNSPVVDPTSPISPTSMSSGGGRYSEGFPESEIGEDEAHDGGGDLDDDDYDPEETREWILDEDRNYVKDVSMLNMTPFIWSPKIIYFRRNDGGDFVNDSARSQRDILGVQVSLFKNRLREIESAIRHYSDIQKQLEYRMAIFFDDSLRQQAENIVEKLSVLYEKKAVIERHIAMCEGSKNGGSDGFPFRRKSRADVPSYSHALFDHHYIVHNINFLWKKRVRNTLFKLFDLQSQDLGIKYFLSNAATRIVKDLVASVAGQSHSNTPGRMDKNTSFYNSDDPISIPDIYNEIDGSTAADSNGSPGKPPSISGARKSGGGVNVLTSLFDKEMAESLLQHLIADRDNFWIPNEVTANAESSLLTNNLSSMDNLSVGAEATRKRFSINSRNVYCPSRNPNSPDYIPEGYSFDSDFVVQLINPQINLECGTKADESQLQTVVVAAENMEVKSISIVDQQAVDASQGFDDRDLNEEIIKTRTILNIENAQFFVARLADIEEAEEADLDNIVMHRGGTNPVGSDTIETPWPIWVPIECLIDHNSHMGHLQRVVEQTSASFHRDKLNPLYVKRNRHGDDHSRRGYAGSRKTGIAEQGDTFHVNFPTFVISVNSVQYLIVYDIITNLLVYRDPGRGERNDRRRKTMLALSQMEDLHKVLELVLSLQEKIRHADSLLKYGLPSTTATRNISPEALAAKYSEIRLCLTQYKEELSIIMESLKQLHTLNRKSKSEEVAWQLFVIMRKINWYMVLDTGERLCRWSLTETRFIWVHNEDQSSSFTVEIDKLDVENLMMTPNSFREIISAYIPDRRPVDFKRHKMLRVYWRELPPVAGIQVVDHFEINIFPLCFQLTYDIGKNLIYYIFPEKKARAIARAAASANNASTSAGPSGFSSFSDSKSARPYVGGSASGDGSEQSTIRSFRSFSESITSGRQLFGSSTVGSIGSSTMYSTMPEESFGEGGELVHSPPQITNSSFSSAYGNIKRRSNPAYSRNWSGGSSSKGSASSTVSSGGGSITNATGSTLSTLGSSSGSPRRKKTVDELRQMQARASENKSFIYTKVPGVQHCLSYRGSKEKNFEDLNMFAFKMPTLEYRNKAWSWLDFLDQVKKDAIRAILSNTASLVKEKFFQRRREYEGPTDAYSISGPQSPPAITAPVSGLGLRNSRSMEGLKQVSDGTVGNNRPFSLLEPSEAPSEQSDTGVGQQRGDSSPSPSVKNKKKEKPTSGNKIKGFFKGRARKGSTAKEKDIKDVVGLGSDTLTLRSTQSSNISFSGNELSERTSLDKDPAPRPSLSAPVLNQDEDEDGLDIEWESGQQSKNAVNKAPSIKSSTSHKKRELEKLFKAFKKH
ncbi:hypothetical protein HK102_004954 [Quaeritorhiza haematococci]|nr:hypothetical protein HK102_004954 [Quaeritorhiza haematococci]